MRHLIKIVCHEGRNEYLEGTLQSQCRRYSVDNSPLHLPITLKDDSFKFYNRALVKKVYPSVHIVDGFWPPEEEGEDEESSEEDNAGEDKEEEDNDDEHEDMESEGEEESEDDDVSDNTSEVDEE
jgi:hypothetical protein